MSDAKRFNDKPALGGDPRQFYSYWERRKMAKQLLEGLREAYQRAPVKLQGLVREALRIESTE